MYFYFPIDTITGKFESLVTIISMTFIIIICYFFYKFLKKSFSFVYDGDLIKNIRYNLLALNVYTLLIWMLILLNVFFIQLSMHMNFSILDCFLIMFVATIVYAIPSAPGTIGSFHLAIQELLVKFLKCNIDSSIAFAFILHAHSYLFFIIIGSYYFLKDSNKILLFKEN